MPTESRQVGFKSCPDTCIHTRWGMAHGRDQLIAAGRPGPARQIQLANGQQEHPPPRQALSKQASMMMAHIYGGARVVHKWRSTSRFSGWCKADHWVWVTNALGASAHRHINILSFLPQEAGRGAGAVSPLRSAGGAATDRSNRGTSPTPLQTSSGLPVGSHQSLGGLMGRDAHGRGAGGSVAVTSGAVVVMVVLSDGRVWQWDVALPPLPPRMYVASPRDTPIVSLTGAK